MPNVSLTDLARTHLEQATHATSGKSAETVVGGHEKHLRQTLIALRAGASLSEHESPGEATLQVLTGRVVLRSGNEEWGGSVGDLLMIPDARHALDATEDSVVLLTVAQSLNAAPAS
jgi:quercetin dioxygenase-like cupin family protein